MAPDPGPKKADLAKGKAVYEQMGCAACHGALGRGNGPSASGLVDDWGMPIRSANLTQGWSYRGGSAPRDIMMRLMAGIDGAGMPSYVGAVTPDDAWQLAYYVASLQEPPHWYQILHAAAVHGELPTAGDDPRWEQAESATLRVRNAVTPGGEWASPPTLRAVTVRVLRNDTDAAFRISWDDPTEDAAAGASDGLALMLKTAAARGDAVSLQAWPYAGAPPLDAVVWTVAGETVTTDVEGLAAATGAPRAAGGAYQDGRWTLVVRRPLRAVDLPDSAALTDDVFAPIAFVVWDGAQPGAHAVSPWIDVQLQDRAGTSH
jgi:DMSO reductase family type II enzyme heme b subunit